MQPPDPLRARTITQQAFVAGCVITFLGWFSMKFHMDNASDSETLAYVNSLIVSATSPRLIAADATGHYTGLAPVVMWPFVATLQLVTGAYLIRALVVCLFVLSAAVYAAAYTWYRLLGLGWLSSLFGLMLLSTSLAFAMLIRGWEIDKLIEPVLFLLSAVAVRHRQYAAVVLIAALAAANRETGAFVALVALAGLSAQGRGLRWAIKQWPVWSSVLVCGAEIAAFHWFGPVSTVQAWESLRLDRLLYVVGGLCLMPLLALFWVPSATPELRRLFFLLAPLWMLWVVATERLEQGAVLLSLVALVFVPVTLSAVEQLLLAPKVPPTPAGTGDARVLGARAAPE